MTHVHDQAEELRKQIEHLKQKGESTDMDVLALPPRSEVHKQKEPKKKTKWKIKYPLVRLLALFFILLPISILTMYYMNDQPSMLSVPRNESESYEAIDIADDRETETPREPEQDAPSDASDADKNEASGGNELKRPQVTTHVVQENETLFSIAMHYYETEKGMEIIKEWNDLKTSQLHKGQVLQIPDIDLSK